VAGDRIPYSYCRCFPYLVALQAACADELFVLQTGSGIELRANSPYPARLSNLSRSAFHHAVVHSAIGLFGASALVLRLALAARVSADAGMPFCFVRRMASERAAIFALAFPALTLTLYYSAQARPYGLLAGALRFDDGELANSDYALCRDAGWRSSLSLWPLPSL